MKSKRTAVLAILFFLLFPAFVSADVISPGEKGVKHCIEISNTDEFPEYDFYLISFLGGVQGIDEMRQGQCESFYKFAVGKIYADKKDPQMVFNEVSLREELMLTDRMRNQTGQDEVLKRLIPSDVDIRLKSTVPMFSLMSGQKDTYTIKSLGSSIELGKSTGYTFDYKMIPTYIVAFAVTILVESLIILALTRKQLGLSFRRSLGYSGMINTITYPIALVLYISFVPSLILVELIVFLAETFL